MVLIIYFTENVDVLGIYDNSYYGQEIISLSRNCHNFRSVLENFITREFKGSFKRTNL